MSTERRSTPAVGNKPRTEAGQALLTMPRYTAGICDFDHDRLALAIFAIESEAASQPAAPPIDAAAMAETLRFLYHADEPCDAPNKHRHDHIAAGIVGQYPRFLARLARQEAPHE